MDAAKKARDDGGDELKTLWRARGISPDDLEERSDGTLIASDRRLAAAVQSATIVVQAARSDRAIVVSNEPIELGRELGRGGMGVVCVGKQATVHREVAVKHVHEAEPQGAGAILKEAWVGGLLDHPNVVPVHTLVAVHDMPAVVMKRIEGTSWTKVMSDPSAYPSLSIHDALEWNVRVLMQVCLAIELAHKKGIVHLDLKPDNVMIGEYGEVYVLDWGLAAAIGDRAPPWLTRASEIRRVAGTPSYMAPELAMVDAANIDERTDVHLLGGMLHHAITGQPPYLAETSFAMLFLAYQSAPHPYGADVPPELAAIAHRAMHRTPKERFGSARALHDALGEFLSRRQAHRLTRQAEDALGLLEQAIAQDADEARVQRLFGECRFALRQAQQSWPENPQVSLLTQRLLERAFDRAIAQQQLPSAEALLGEMPTVPARCAAALDELRARLRDREARVQALETMQKELDLALGRRSRRRLAMGLGAMWALVSFGLAYVHSQGLLHIGYREIFVEGALIALALGPYGLWRRRELFGNKANARWQLSMVLTFFVVEAFFVAGACLGVPFETALALTPFFYSFVFAAVALMVDWRVAPSALVMALTGAACVAWPGHALELIGLGGGVAVAGLAWAWRDSSNASA